jgi:hypothetical protein
MISSREDIQSAMLPTLCVVSLHFPELGGLESLGGSTSFPRSTMATCQENTMLLTHRMLS